MRAISIKQPYVAQILGGVKREEYRSWPTRHRGDLLIVSSAQPQIGDLPCGQALAIVSVVDCRRTETGYAWTLDNVRPIIPFPVRGQLGFYDVQVPISLR